MTTEPNGDQTGAEREARPMSRERLRTPEMQALVGDAERLASTGRRGGGSTAEDLSRMARELRDLDRRAIARGEAR